MLHVRGAHVELDLLLPPRAKFVPLALGSLVGAGAENGRDLRARHLREGGRLVVVAGVTFAVLDERRLQARAAEQVPVCGVGLGPERRVPRALLARGVLPVRCVHGATLGTDKLPRAARRATLAAADAERGGV